MTASWLKVITSSGCLTPALPSSWTRGPCRTFIKICCCSPNPARRYASAVRPHPNPWRCVCCAESCCASDLVAVQTKKELASSTRYSSLFIYVVSKGLLFFTAHGRMWGGLWDVLVGPIQSNGVAEQTQGRRLSMAVAVPRQP